jgi:uncharacterized protein
MRMEANRPVPEQLRTDVPGEAPDGGDGAVASAVDRLLRGLANSPSWDLHAAVHDGVVTLSGTVEWEFERRTVVTLVRSLRGVRGVVNDIVLLDAPSTSPAPPPSRTGRTGRRAGNGGTLGTTTDGAAPVERLDTADCWRLLARTPLARLAVRDGDGVDVFPVNYGIDGDRLVLRTTHGAKLTGITAHSSVALEIDGHDGAQAWSVVVKGTARTPERREELERLHALGLESESPVFKSAYVVIEPAEVTGRRFLQHADRDPDWR